MHAYITSQSKHQTFLRRWRTLAMVSAMKTPAVDIAQVSLLPGRGQLGRHARVRPRYPHLLTSRSLPTKRNSLGRTPTPCAPRRVPMNRDPPYRLTRLVYLPAISRTTRKRALPLIMRSYASAVFSKGKISFMECTSVEALNSSVSCESIEAPEYQPFTDR